MNKLITQFRTAFSNLKRNLAMTLSSSLAVMVTLTLIMFFVAVGMNINSVSNRVDKSVEIFAQIDDIVPADKYEELADKVKALPHVAKVRISDKEDQKRIFLKSEGGEEYRNMFEEGNPLSAALFVEATKGKYITKLNNEIKHIDGISSSQYGGEAAKEMLYSFNQMKIWGGVVVVGLALLALFLISNTIEITINARKDEIAIMRNVGASNLYIKIPFMIEGMIIGLLGAIIPILIAIFGYHAFYNMMNGIFFSNLFPMVKPAHFSVIMMFGLTGMGVLVGVIGSLLSVNKYLRWKR